MMRFETFRYFDLALAGYVGDEVSALTKIYVFGDKGFICEVRR